ncbi:MAG TPA: O-antigen ligase family protein [Patescibacteria group bacterium]|nr:O-antigen ligase family protein [Patescibacteria group bacterium]
MGKWIDYCTTAIRYSIYALFFFVPLFFWSDTSELFEFNKMWLTFWLSLVIFAAWGSKMVLEKQFIIQRTIFDIPLLLFLVSQIISTIFSMNSYISWWGYYSRFNGGLLSTITYLFLYYAIVTNLKKQDILKLLWISVISCVFVALWGLPSHFGYDPTCLLFRGTFDVSCWTDAFKPTVRIFSTLGQPDWMAAYLSILLPITFALGIRKFFNSNSLSNSFQSYTLNLTTYLLLIILFYFDLLFTNTRAGFVGFWIADIIFWLVILFTQIFSRKVWLQLAITVNVLLLLCNFFFRTPIDQLNKFTLNAITSHFSVQTSPLAKTSSTDNSITDSGTIRLLVWQGAIKAWEAHPIFGTGVETFAFAYYQYRPVAHNMTSEWDYLYNKAHNEYLNYLATTGIVGLGTYLLFISWYMISSILYIYKHLRDPKTRDEVLWTVAFASAFISILVSNFFGFSVVIINEFLFLIPAFFLILTGKIEKKQNDIVNSSSVSAVGWTLITIIAIVALYYELILFSYWSADRAYALGHNYDSVSQYQQANQPLVDAVNMRPDEPTFQDELSVNEAAMAVIYAQNKDMTNAQTYAKQAITTSNSLTTEYPSDVLFWKSRTRIFVMLGALNSDFLNQALIAIQAANTLAPTDAKIMYNLGVLYGRTGNVQKGAQVLEQTIKAKPDYSDAYYALGLFYHTLATDKNGKVIDPQMQQKAIEQMQFILTNLDSKNADALKSLKDWGVK